MSIRIISLLTIAFFAQSLSAPLQAGWFDSCWRRAPQEEQSEEVAVAEEVASVEVEQSVETVDTEEVFVEKTPLELCGEALINGNVDAFREHLAFVEDLEATIENFNLVGMVAATGTEEFLEILLEREPKVDIILKDDEGFAFTPLQLACMMNNVTVAKALVLKAGADVNFFHRETGCGGPLHTAIKYNNLELVRFFIEHGADLTETITHEGKEVSVLDLAVRLRNPVITSLIRRALEESTEETQEEFAIDAEIQAEEEPVEEVVAEIEAQAEEEPVEEVVAEIEAQAEEEPVEEVVAEIEAQAEEEPVEEVVAEMQIEEVNEEE